MIQRALTALICLLTASNAIAGECVQGDYLLKVFKDGRTPSAEELRSIGEATNAFSGCEWRDEVSPPRFCPPPGLYVTWTHHQHRYWFAVSEPTRLADIERDAQRLSPALSAAFNYDYSSAKVFTIQVPEGACLLLAKSSELTTAYLEALKAQVEAYSNRIAELDHAAQATARAEAAKKAGKVGAAGAKQLFGEGDNLSEQLRDGLTELATGGPPGEPSGSEKAGTKGGEPEPGTSGGESGGAKDGVPGGGETDNGPFPGKAPLWLQVLCKAALKHLGIENVAEGMAMVLLLVAPQVFMAIADFAKNLADALVPKDLSKFLDVLADIYRTFDKLVSALGTLKADPSLLKKLGAASDILNALPENKISQTLGPIAKDLKDAMNKFVDIQNSAQLAELNAFVNDLDSRELADIAKKGDRIESFVKARIEKELPRVLEEKTKALIGQELGLTPEELKPFIDSKGDPERLGIAVRDAAVNRVLGGDRAKRLREGGLEGAMTRELETGFGKALPHAMTQRRAENLRSQIASNKISGTELFDALAHEVKGTRDATALAFLRRAGNDRNAEVRALKQELGTALEKLKVDAKEVGVLFADGTNKLGESARTKLSAVLMARGVDPDAIDGIAGDKLAEKLVDLERARAARELGLPENIELDKVEDAVRGRLEGIMADAEREVEVKALWTDGVRGLYVARARAMLRGAEAEWRVAVEALIGGQVEFARTQIAALVAKKKGVEADAVDSRRALREWLDAVAGQDRTMLTASQLELFWKVKATRVFAELRQTLQHGAIDEVELLLEGKGEAFRQKARRNAASRLRGLRDAKGARLLTEVEIDSLLEQHSPSFFAKVQEADASRARALSGLLGIEGSAKNLAAKGKFEEALLQTVEQVAGRAKPAAQQAERKRGDVWRALEEARLKTEAEAYRALCRRTLSTTGIACPKPTTNAR